MSEPAVSVIVAVKDGARTLAQCLASLCSLDYPEYEIIVVDDGSRDDTPRILSSFAGRVRVLTNEASLGPSRARNRAAAEAGGELIAFTDGDCIADRQWLRELVRCFDAPETAAAGGAQFVPGDDSAFGRELSSFMRSLGFITDYLHKGEGFLRRVDHNPSCNSIYRKDLFLSAGGFLAGLWPGEDVELDYRLRRLGHTIMFNPAARVYHYRPGSMRGFYRAMERYGWAQAVLVRKYGFFRKIQYVPLVCLAVGALAAGAAVFHAPAGLAFMAALATGAYGYFAFKARNAAAGGRHFCLAFVLLWAWNRGYARGIFSGKEALP